MADTRTVNVVDRGMGYGDGGYHGLRIVSVKLNWVCPKCGSERGEPYPYNFAEDGGYYVCDRWDNPCDHIDMYPDVLREAMALARTATA